MDIYLKRRRGKILFLLIAIVIGVASLLYTNWLTKKMAREEQQKVRLWAKATENINDISITLRNDKGEPVNEAGTLDPEKISKEKDELESKYLDFLSLVNSQNTNIPIIVVNENGTFVSDANISYNKGPEGTSSDKRVEKDESVLRTITL